MFTPVIFQRREPSAAIERLERLELSAALMGDVPDLARQEVAVPSRHRISLEAHFQDQKPASKLLKNAFYSNVPLINKQLVRSDPPWVSLLKLQTV